MEFLRPTAGAGAGVVAAAVKGSSVDGLALRIRSARRALGLAQRAFAARIGVTRAW
jgi:DNA-binding transcriptional regulator YiaG